MQALGDGHGSAPRSPATARTASTVSSGRSHAATTTPSAVHAGRNQRRASTTPPRGPSPGHVSATNCRPVVAVSRLAVTPRRTPPVGNRRLRAPRATCSAIGRPSISTSALSRPNRRLAPPHSTAPPVPPASPVTPADRPGSSCWRNCPQRSASSTSPIAAAISCKPAQAAEEPDVRRFRPAHVSRPAPAVRPQRVEAAVVADAIRGIALDRVGGRRRRGPPRPPTKAWMVGDDRGDRVAALVRRARAAPRRGGPRPPGSAAGSTVDGNPPGDIVIGRSSAIRDSGYPAHLS